jgi:hypothetical protein
MSGAIPPLRYMSTINVLSGAEVENEWSYTYTSTICLQQTSYLQPSLRLNGAIPPLPLYVSTQSLIWCRG